MCRLDPPVRDCTAPVNAPRVWPNSSASSKASGIAAQFNTAKGLPAPLTQPMQRPRNDFFSRPCLSFNQYSRRPRCHQPNQPRQLPHRLARPNHLRQHNLPLHHRPRNLWTSHQGRQCLPRRIQPGILVPFARLVQPNVLSQVYRCPPWRAAPHSAPSRRNHVRSGRPRRRIVQRSVSAPPAAHAATHSAADSAPLHPPHHLLATTPSPDTAFESQSQTHPPRDLAASYPQAAPPTASPPAAPSPPRHPKPREPSTAARSTKHAASAATPHPRSRARPFASPPLRSHLHSTPLPVPCSSRSPYPLVFPVRHYLLQYRPHRPNCLVQPPTLLQPLTNRLAHRIWLTDKLSHRQPALEHRQRLTKTMQRHIDSLNQIHSIFLLHGLTHRQTPHSREIHSPAPSPYRHPSGSPRPGPSGSRATPSSPSTLAAPSFRRR